MSKYIINKIGHRWHWQVHVRKYWDGLFQSCQVEYFMSGYNSRCVIHFLAAWICKYFFFLFTTLQ